MTNATASTNAQQCQATSTEYVVQKPCAGSNVIVDISKDEPTAFNFAVEDIRAMQLLADGGLLVKFVDGSTLTVANFEEARANFAFSDIQLNDGTVMNLQKLAQGLEGTLPQDTVADLTILKPQGGLGVTELQFALQEGKVYTLGFGMDEVSSVEPRGTDLIITFNDGSTLILQNYAAVTEGVLPPQMTLADGSVIPAAHLINVLNVAIAKNVTDVEPAAGDVTETPAAAQVQQVAAVQQPSPEELALLEPAAGEPGAGGAGGAGGYGFNSSVDDAGINGLAAVGPIGITALQFALPELEIFPTAAAPAAAPLVPGDPSLSAVNRAGYEDSEINLSIGAAGNNNSAQEILTITVSNIPAGWIVLPKSGGTFNAATGTWTITLPQGTPFTGGPYVKPPLNSDADITGANPLQVTVSSRNTQTGEVRTTTSPMEVLVDAVADKPELTVGNAAGSDNVPLPLSISASLTDGDGSEVFTGASLSGIPAGFTLSHGTYDAATGVWTVNPADLSNLSITPPRGYTGFFDVTVRVENEEVNLTDAEITTSNNTNFNEQTFRVTFTDTAPTIGDAESTTDDTGLVAGDNVVSGRLDVDYHADAPGSIALTGVNPGGSLQNGALSSNGSPVTISLSGNTYTGTDANGNVVFTLVLQPDGQYTFTQKAPLDHADATNPDDIITLTFQVTATDSDGSTSIGNIVINVHDDAPVAVDDTFNNVTSGNVITNDQLSQDDDNTVYDVIFGGETQTFDPANPGTPLVFNNASGTLEIYADGTFTYTPPVPGQNGTFQYRLIDGDGDISTAGAKDYADVTITLPSRPDIGDSAVTTDETTLPANNGTQTVDGTYSYNYGGNGQGNGGITTTGYNGPNLTSGGVAVVVSETTPGVYVGTAGGNTIFTMTINTDGTYSFELSGVLDHPNTSDHDDVLGLTFGLQIENADNQIDTGTITVNVRDDGPIAVNDTFTSSTGTASGNVTANDNYGADGAGHVSEVTFGGETQTLTAGQSITFNNAAGQLVIDSTGQFTFTPPVPGNDVTFTYKIVDGDGDVSATDANGGTVYIDTNGTPVITGSNVTVDETNMETSGQPQTVNGTYTFDFGGDGQGTTGGISHTGYNGPALTSGGVAVVITQVSPGVYVGSAGGTEVFRMSITDNGTYSFTLSGVLDHPNTSNPDDSLFLSFGLQIQDADGETATANIVAEVRDDGPIAHNDNFVSSTGTATGNITANDNFGADGAGHVTEVTFGGQTQSIPANGQNVIFNNAAGMLIINANGDFTFTPPQAGQDVTFTYKIVDGDGDVSSVDADHGTVYIDTNGVPVIGDDIINTDETSLVAGPKATNGSIGIDFQGETGTVAFDNNGFTADGSLKGNQLSSGGSPVTTTLSGNTYTGTDANGNVVFTIALNQNGTYTFTQFRPLDHADGSNPDDVINLKFDVTGTDASGDTDGGTITVRVFDDAPAAQDDTVNMDQNLVATGNVRTNDILGQDGPVPVTHVTFKGMTYNVPATGDLTINGDHGVLKINVQGQYTYTSNNTTTGRDEFTYRITDFDGDSSTANLNVSITDINYTPVVDNSTATVDETDMNNTTTVSGQLNVDYFGDGPGTINPLNTVSSTGSKLGGNLTSGGVAVVTTLSGNTYTGKAGNETVFTLTVNADGSYTYTQFKGLDHADSANPNDVINLHFTVQAKDADGDTDTGVITIRVLDDAPVARDDAISIGDTSHTANVLTNDTMSKDSNNTVTQIEFNGNTYNVPANGNLTVNGVYGTLVINASGQYTYTSKNTAKGTDVFTYTLKDADGDTSKANLNATINDLNTVPVVGNQTSTVDEGGSKTTTGTITVNYGEDGPGSVYVCGGNNFNASGSMANNALTSGGVAVAVTSTSTGYVGTAGGVTVFTLTLNANGTYTFNLLRPLDHKVAGEDIINLNFQVCARDSDGSVGHGTLTINVRDDVPVAKNDVAIFCAYNPAGTAGDGVHVGNLLSGWNNTSTGANGADESSFDGSWLYNVTGAKGSATMNSNGAGVVEGQYGMLYVFADGTYTYVQQTMGYHTDTFTYMLRDGDGDTSTATLTLKGQSTQPAGNADNIIHAYNGGTTNGTNGNDIIMSMSDGLVDVLQGGNGNDVLFGWNGHDTLRGGAGNDVLFGEYGADTLYGGTGTDIFVASSADFVGGYSGKYYDKVMDFNVNEGDMIDLSALIDNGSAAQNAINNYVRSVDVGNDAMLQIKNAAGQWQDAMLIAGHNNLNVQELLDNGNLNVD